MEFPKLKTEQNVTYTSLGLSPSNVVTFSFQSMVKNFRSFTLPKILANVCPTHGFERGCATDQGNSSGSHRFFFQRFRKGFFWENLYKDSPWDFSSNFFRNYSRRLYYWVPPKIVPGFFPGIHPGFPRYSFKHSGFFSRASLSDI